MNRTRLRLLKLYIVHSINIQDRIISLYMSDGFIFRTANKKESSSQNLGWNKYLRDAINIFKHFASSSSSSFGNNQVITFNWYNLLTLPVAKQNSN